MTTKNVLFWDVAPHLGRYFIVTTAKNSDPTKLWNFTFLDMIYTYRFSTDPLSYTVSPEGHFEITISLNVRTTAQITAKADTVIPTDA